MVITHIDSFRILLSFVTSAALEARYFVFCIGGGFQHFEIFYLLLLIDIIQHQCGICFGISSGGQSSY
jgi:hypothetical protein